MSELRRLVDHCRQLLTKGETLEAIEELTGLLANWGGELYNEISLHSSRLLAIDERSRKGLITMEEAETQRLRLTSALLDLLDVIPRNVPISENVEDRAAVMVGCKTSLRSERSFDVFLSHNSKDKQVVEEIGRRLEQRGLRTWLDVRDLIPGRPWQAEIEEILSAIQSVVVFVGPDGLGPWETAEMRVCLDQAVRRQLPVIPVLLPGAVDAPVLPPFLGQHTCVDLSAGVTIEGLDRLELGISGRRL